MASPLLPPAALESSVDESFGDTLTRTVSAVELFGGARARAAAALSRAELDTEKSGKVTHDQLRNFLAMVQARAVCVLTLAERPGAQRRGVGGGAVQVGSGGSRFRQVLCCLYARSRSLRPVNPHSQADFLRGCEALIDTLETGVCAHRIWAPLTPRRAEAPVECVPRSRCVRSRARLRAVPAPTAAQAVARYCHRRWTLPSYRPCGHRLGTSATTSCSTSS